MSLRRRILALVVASTVSVMLLLAVPLWVLLDRSATEDSREAAAEVARGVADYVSTGPPGEGVLTAYVERLNARDDRAEVTVVLPDGRLIGADLPAAAPDDLNRPHARGEDDDGDERGDDDGLLPVSEPEVHDVAGGQLVSVWTTTADGPAAVVAYASFDQARTQVAERLVALGAAALLLVLLAAGAAEIVTRRLVRELDETAAVADRLSEGDLSARAPEDGGASEVQRVSAALNRLAGRIGELLAGERETVADLSHRLRTPLTAVRLDVEGLPPSERTEELEAHLEHLERTLTSVIRAARRTEREGVRPQCDAAQVLREGVDFWRPLAEDQDRAVTLEVPDAPVEVRCAGDDLRAAVDALLENCIAHTPEGVALSVRLEGPAPGAPGLVRLEIRDQGPGIPSGASRRGRSDRGSTGLGLDIARTCAEVSGGRMEIVAEDGWQVVRLLLGRP